MRWVEALKLWNAQHNPGKWCVVRKGTPEYDEVKKIQGVPEKRTRVPKEKKTIERPFVIEAGARSLSPEEVKATARARAKAARETKLAPARATAKREKVKAFLGKVLERRRAAKAAKTEEAKPVAAPTKVESLGAYPKHYTKEMIALIEEGKVKARAREEAAEKAKKEKEELRQAKKAEAAKAKEESGGAKRQYEYLRRMEEVGLRSTVHKGPRTFSSTFITPNLSKAELIEKLKQVGHDTIRAAKGELVTKGKGKYVYEDYQYEPAITRTIDDFAKTLPSNKVIRASFANSVLHYSFHTPQEAEKLRAEELSLREYTFGKK